MNKKYLYWIIPLTLIIGLLVGFGIDFPNKFEIIVEVQNETKDWGNSLYEEFVIDYNLSKISNMCCYPIECKQARNNPDMCTCTYMVYCYSENESISRYNVTNEKINNLILDRR